MCLAQWETEYDLMENTTPVSPRALLLVLRNAENNSKVDNKPPGANKAEGAEGKCKIALIDSHIPKRLARCWLIGLRSIACYARSMGGNQEP